jgi:hypothetical protein
MGSEIVEYTNIKIEVGREICVAIFSMVVE